MKKVLITICVALLSLVSYAQETSSTSSSSTSMWLGGGVTLSDSWSVSPTFGYALNETMGVGASVAFADGGAWEVAPYFRYYVGITDNFKFYGDAVVAFGGYEVAGVDINTFDVGAAPGFQYWFTPRWSMASTLGWVGYESVDGDGDFELTVDFSAVNFAFFWHF